MTDKASFPLMYHEPPYRPFAGRVVGVLGDDSVTVYYGPWCDLETRADAEKWAEEVLRLRKTKHLVPPEDRTPSLGKAVDDGKDTD